MEGWYVAKSKPQQEGSLISFLSQWDVEVFFPKILCPGPTKGIWKALFPTYMFCHLDPESSVWPVVRWAPGMRYFLNCDGVPSRVPQSLVDYLRQRVSQWSETGGARRLTQGDKVVVLGGPFAGIEGSFLRYMPSKERCRILLDVVGSLSTVDLPEWDVKEASHISLASAQPMPIGSKLA